MKHITANVWQTQQLVFSIRNLFLQNQQYSNHIVKSCEYNSHCLDRMQCRYITVFASVQCYASCWSHTKQSTRHYSTQDDTGMVLLMCAITSHRARTHKGRNYFTAPKNKELHTCIRVSSVVKERLREHPKVHVQGMESVDSKGLATPNEWNYTYLEG